MMVWKSLAAVGLALMLAGLAGACWPEESVFARSRRLVEAPTWTRRGPRVVVDRPAAIVRDGSGRALSIPGVLGGDGYRASVTREYLTRVRLRDARVLVLDRRPEDLGGARTRTLVARWISEGGAALVLAPGTSTRRIAGAGRVATLDPAAFATADFVAALLDAMHWLSGVPVKQTR